MSNVTQNPVVESTKTKVEIKTAIENAVKTNQWREVNLLGIINEPLETEDYDVFVPKMGEILILKLKDDKDQWYFASTLRNTGTKGFIHVNAITIFGPNGTYREKRKREPLEKGLLLRTNKVLVKECGFSHWSIPMLDDSLGYDIAHSAWDVCNQDYKDLFINVSKFIR